MIAMTSLVKLIGHQGDTVCIHHSIQSAATTALTCSYHSLVEDAPVSGQLIRVLGYHARGKQKIPPPSMANPG